MKIDETAFDPEHPKVAIRINNLGEVLRQQGNFERAQEAFGRAIKIGEIAFGHCHPQVEKYINNLG